MDSNIFFDSVKFLFNLCLKKFGNKRNFQMNNKFKISGIHHITAIASSASENLAFYENVLGLQLVKKTVNFDDPHGLSLELIETPTVHSILNQSGNSKSVASRIVGFHSATALLISSEETRSLFRLKI